MTEKRYVEGVKGFDDYGAWDNKSEQGLSHSEVINELNRLSEENEKLKHRINGLKSELSIWKEDANEHIKETNKLFEENKDLKDFIRKISTNNEIILANGTIYKIDKVIK